VLQDFVLRCSRFTPTAATVYESESGLLEGIERSPRKTPAGLILFDSSGELLTSMQFAEVIGRLRDSSIQRLVFAIGPADGWSPAALARADRTISFGRMTLPHELARVVLAEQVYRALTILAGHPYHCGH
jgi:23S rRNA (pseudouridine1915-N3)-methyltransferase